MLVRVLVRVLVLVLVLVESLVRSGRVGGAQGGPPRQHSERPKTRVQFLAQDVLSGKEEEADGDTFSGAVISSRVGHPRSSVQRAPGRCTGAGHLWKRPPGRQRRLRPSQQPNCSPSRLPGTRGPPVPCTYRVQAEWPEVKFQLSLGGELSDPEHCPILTVSSVSSSVEWGQHIACAVVLF